MEKINKQPPPDEELYDELSRLNNELANMHRELAKKNTELKQALANIKQLKGLLPLCANCKKVREDTGYWKQIELYIVENSDAEITHGICPECRKELYPDLDDET